MTMRGHYAVGDLVQEALEIVMTQQPPTGRSLRRTAHRTRQLQRPIVAAVPHHQPHQDDNFLDKLSVDEINDWGGKPPTPLLDTVNYPVHLKNFNVPQLRQLCKELRADVIHTVSRTGGHLGSSLGVTELTVALHYVFNMPEDKVIWDVGHQAYVHKMLTGRRKQMATIRQTGGLSGAFVYVLYVPTYTPSNDAHHVLQALPSATRASMTPLALATRQRRCQLPLAWRLVAT